MKKSKPVLTTAPAFPSHETISTRAYALWQERGCPEGQATEIWFEAEQALLAQLNARSARQPDDVRSPRQEAL